MSNFVVVHMEQGTEEWLEWRQDGIGASEAPAIMGENPWKSVKALLKEKLENRRFEPNAAMRRGTELEPIARRRYEERFAVNVYPACLQSNRYPWLRASVDGLSKDHNRLVEIKCGERVYEQTAENGEPPHYYYGQLQHMLAVTGLPKIDFWCYLPKRPEVHVTVDRDNEYIARLLQAEKEFWDLLESRRLNNTPSRRNASAWSRTDRETSVSKKSHPEMLEQSLKTQANRAIADSPSTNRGAQTQPSNRPTQTRVNRRFLNVVCSHCHVANELPTERIYDIPHCGKCHKSLFGNGPAELSGTNFERHLTRNDIPLLVDFWAPWCAPCRAMAPAFVEAAAQLEPEVRLAKVNTEDEQAIGARYVIRSIPTMILFRAGKEVARQSGAMMARDIVRWVRDQK